MLPLIVLALYVAGLLTVGVISSRKVKGQRDFTLAANWYPRENIRVMFNYVTGYVDSLGDSEFEFGEGRFNIVQARVLYAF